MKNNSNLITTYGNVSFIFLNKGYVAIIDTKDIDLVKTYKWYAYDKPTRRSVYVYSYNAKQLHRLLLNITDPSIQGEHKDSNGLNNRCDNLRLATNSQNHQHRENYYNNKFIGVSYNKYENCYRGRVTLNKKQYYTKRYNTELQAAKARDDLALKLHDTEFVTINNYL